MVKSYLINIHSIIDIITNLSTELFIIDKSCIQDDMKELFKFLLGIELDSESTIQLYAEYEYKDDIDVSDFTSVDNLYVLDISHHNLLLKTIVNKFFNPIEL